MEEQTSDQQGGQNTNEGSNKSPTAVPYTPPVPPSKRDFSLRFKSPLVNMLLIVGVILVGGFMTYNAVGHELTQISGESIQRVVTPTPSATPTPTTAYFNSTK
jgi:hypothetical protein